MNENYDRQFDNFRLSQLADQCLSDLSVSCDVVFRFSAEDMQSGHYTWKCTEEDERIIEESGFKGLLMRLLNDLVTYRSRCGVEHSTEGLVSVHNSSPSIQWLPDGQGEKLANSWWREANE